MRVLLRVGAPMTARLVAALAHCVEIVHTASWLEASGQLAVGEFAAAVVDPFAEETPTRRPNDLPAAVRHAANIRRDVAWILYLRPEMVRAAVPLFATRTCDMVLWGYDDRPSMLIASIRSAAARTLAGRVLASLCDALSPLPDALRRSIGALFCDPRPFRTTHHLAASARLSDRSLHRRFKEAGLCSPHVMCCCARMVYACSILSAPGATLLDAAHALGDTSTRRLVRDVASILGSSGRALTALAREPSPLPDAVRRAVTAKRQFLPSGTSEARKVTNSAPEPRRGRVAN